MPLSDTNDKDPHSEVIAIIATPNRSSYNTVKENRNTLAANVLKSIDKNAKLSTNKIENQNVRHQQSPADRLKRMYGILYPKRLSTVDHFICNYMTKCQQKKIKEFENNSEGKVKAKKIKLKNSKTNANKLDIENRENQISSSSKNQKRNSEEIKTVEEQRVKSILSLKRLNCKEPLDDIPVQKKVKIENLSLKLLTEKPIEEYRTSVQNQAQQTDICENTTTNNIENMAMYDYASQSSATSASVNEFVSSKIINNSSTDDSMQYIHSLATPMATLCNIGNTCYLNSVVYTLRFAPLFLHNLHHLIEDLSQVNQKLCQNKAKSSSLGRNIGGLQGPNTRSWSTKDLASVGSTAVDVPKTPRQVATEKLHELYANLHRNEMIESTEAFHADTFLGAVQDVSSIFGGNQQQDAHEFLMCLLDSIRETCQSLAKVVVDCPDILMNGYVNFSEKTEPQQPLQQTPIVKSLPFFRKRNKEDKPKNNRLNSPMKEVDATDSTNNHLPPVKSSAGSNSNTDANDAHDKQKLANEKNKKLGFDFFTEDFEGVTVSSTKCLSCETITEQEETMIDISVPITGFENIERETIDNHNLFIQNLCITREHFRGENKYRCEVCDGLTEAIRTVKYKKLPRLLIIQLKRFSGGMEKINSYIPTPFTMQCFCAKCCDLPDKDKHHVYKLYSVVTHVGATLSVGHYIAYTCSLGNNSEYLNCPKDKRKQQQQQQAMTQATGHSGSNEKSIVKKMMFIRSKASSSGDVTKNLNGGGLGKGMINGIDKFNSYSNTFCQSLHCCGIYLKNGQNGQNSCNNNSNFINGISDSGQRNNSSGVYNDNITNDSYGSSISHHHRYTDPVWHMCDDDKIKAMSQAEFKELLLPNNKKAMVTPYLLFYARTDTKMSE